MYADENENHYDYQCRMCYERKSNFTLLTNRREEIHDIKYNGKSI